jgi:hypothetical protein
LTIVTGSDAPLLVPKPAAPLTGTERFVGVDASVIEFWRWAFSDLRDNTIRAALAEFLVAKAVGDTRGLRIGWDNFDVLAPDGTRIEVKCSAFLQSWAQRHPSRLVFARLRGREFDASLNEYSADEKVRADVFVFAVQTQLDPAEYDLLDLGHWQFWVVNATAIRNETRRSVDIAWVRDNAEGPVTHTELAEAIAAATRR